MSARTGFTAALALAAAVTSSAAPPSLPPPPSRWATDGAGFLSERARRSLDSRLEAYQRATGRQVIVWIGVTAGDTPVEDFAVRAFESWGVGRKGLDDGLALFVFTQDRKIRFEVGYGVEDRLPDVVAARIIREIIAPRLQAGDRDGAIEAGIDAALAALGGGTALAERPPRRGRPATLAQKILVGVVLVGLLLFILSHPSLAYWMLVTIASGDTRRGSRRQGGWGGGFGTGGGGGWGGGGGFSGGGGRSGGGGATGSW